MAWEQVREQRTAFVRTIRTVRCDGSRTCAVHARLCPHTVYSLPRGRTHIRMSSVSMCTICRSFVSRSQRKQSQSFCAPDRFLWMSFRISERQDGMRRGLSLSHSGLPLSSRLRSHPRTSWRIRLHRLICNIFSSLLITAASVLGDAGRSSCSAG